MPRKPKLDPKQVENLAAIQCSYEEMAYVLGCDPSTLTKSARYSQAIEAGRARGRMSLKRKQWETAMQGSTTMQIWLGKQYLGQKDKQEITQDFDAIFTVESPTAGVTKMGIVPKGLK